MKLNNICKAYTSENEDVTVFDGFSAEFENSKFSWIMGKSGCGKTTLLRIIAGLEAFDGQITEKPQGDIALVFQENRLFEQLSPIENCLLVSNENQPAYVKKLLLSAGLSPDDIIRKASTLSGGMKRRTAVVRAMCTNSPIILMDEPFKEIDPDNKLKTAALVEKICEHKTVIAVTHDIADTELIKGKIHRIG